MVSIDGIPKPSAKDLVHSTDHIDRGDNKTDSKGKAN